MDSTAHSGRNKTFRGSHRRIRRIKMRGNGSWQVWMLLGMMVFVLLVLIPWMARHGS
jgi:hypothetical protein